MNIASIVIMSIMKQSFIINKNMTKNKVYINKTEVSILWLLQSDMESII